MPVANIPFSKSRRVGELIFLSGELPFRDDGSIPDGIGPQTDLTLERIGATLASEGSSLADVVSCTIYLTDARDFAGFNDAYRRHFSDPLPVRSTVTCGLVAPARIEITVVAAVRDRDSSAPPS